MYLFWEESEDAEKLKYWILKLPNIVKTIINTKTYFNHISGISVCGTLKYIQYPVGIHEKIGLTFF